MCLQFYYYYYYTPEVWGHVMTQIRNDVKESVNCPLNELLERTDSRTCVKSVVAL